MIAGKRVVAIIQARMSSSRLPGKVLMPLGGRLLIDFMLARVARAHLLDEIVVATSTDASDDALADHLAEGGVTCWRGSLNDVLARFAGAAREYEADIAVRLTGDCPLIDPEIIDAVVARLAQTGSAYVSNVDPASFPDGLDVEAMTSAALALAEGEATLQSDREHVTPFIRNQRERFPSDAILSAIDLSALRWTVDYADDLEAVRHIVDTLGDAAIDADRFDILRVIERLGWEGAAHARNEGLAKSLRED